MGREKQKIDNIKIFLINISKPIGFVIICLLFSSCWEIDRCKNKSYPYIHICDWTGKPLPKKGKIIVYKKGSDFKKNIKEEDKLIVSYSEVSQGQINTGQITVYFPELGGFYPNRDYQLILDDTLVYKISDIISSMPVNPDYCIMTDERMRLCSISSLKINDKIIENPETLRFSRNTGNVIKE